MAGLQALLGDLGRFRGAYLGSLERIPNVLLNAFGLASPKTKGL
jgi:hypothetical protein